MLRQNIINSNVLIRRSVNNLSFYFHSTIFPYLMCFISPTGITNKSHICGSYSQWLEVAASWHFIRLQRAPNAFLRIIFRRTSFVCVCVCVFNLDMWKSKIQRALVEFHLLPSDICGSRDDSRNHLVHRTNKTCLIVFGSDGKCSSLIFWQFPNDDAKMIYRTRNLVSVFCPEDYRRDLATGWALT